MMTTRTFGWLSSQRCSRAVNCNGELPANMLVLPPLQRPRMLRRSPSPMLRKAASTTRNNSGLLRLRAKAKAVCSRATK
ncbi:hypothetical protein D3C75_1214620 [compost metagenome]